MSKNTLGMLRIHFGENENFGFFSTPPKKIRIGNFQVLGGHFESTSSYFMIVLKFFGQVIELHAFGPPAKTAEEILMGPGSF